MTQEEFNRIMSLKEDFAIPEELFLSPNHKALFEEFLRRDRTCKEDKERKALFYILSGCPDLISKGIDRIYDFDGHMLKFSPEEEDMNKYLSRFSLCSSSRALLLMVCNLYNGSYKSLTFADTFYNLGEDLRALAINSLKIRFERKFIDS